MDYSVFTKKENKIVQKVNSSKNNFETKGWTFNKYLFLILGTFFASFSFFHYYSHGDLRYSGLGLSIGCLFYSIFFLIIEILIRNSIIKKLSKQLGITKDDIPK